MIRNVGKAEAVRQGVRFCNSTYDHQYIAFLDADLSTSLSECIEMSAYLRDKTSFVFGSRIMKIGSVIERSSYRFLIGRVLATLISWMLSLKVYDTQCGCKLFTKNLSGILFQETFISNWLFDVELFFRMILANGTKSALLRMVEIPLKQWIDKGHSKVAPSYFFKMCLDLFRIKIHYSKALKTYRSLHEDGKTFIWKYEQNSKDEPILRRP